MANITDPSILNFTDRVLNKCGGTLTATDNDALGQYLLDGCYDVVNRISKSSPGMLELFVASTTTTSAVAVNLTSAGIKSIVGADREGYPCRAIKAKDRYNISDNTSMYYVDEDSDPVFYIHNDIFYIKPTVVNENGGATYYYLPHYTITNWDSGTSKIDNFPPDFYQHVCLYGAIQVIKRRLLDAIDDII